MGVGYNFDNDADDCEVILQSKILVHPVHLYHMGEAYARHKDEEGSAIRSSGVFGVGPHPNKEAQKQPCAYVER